MFSTLLQELKGYFGRDYLLGVFFPLLFFLATNLALYLEVTRGLNSAIAAWDKLSLSTQVLLFVSGFTIAAIFSFLIYNFQYTITRLFEGYWYHIPLLGRLRDWRAKFHLQRWYYLDALQQAAHNPTLANEISAEKLAFYPPPTQLDKILPTRIGNILRASEIHAYERYKIDSTVIWTRLQPLLGVNSIAAIEDKKVARDFSLLMSLLAAAITLIWCPVLAVFTDRWDLFLLCALGWILALISYRNAVQSTLAYAEQIKATFDVNRHLLLKALGRNVPKDIADERIEWLRLTRFFYRNYPLPAASATPEEPKGWERVAIALAACLEKECALEITTNPQPAVADKNPKGESQ